MSSSSSSTSSTTTRSSGPGTLGLLGVAFVILKLCHVINWSWWWVLLPFYAGLLIIAAILVLWLVGAIIAAFFQGRARKKRINRNRALRGLPPL